MIEKEKNDPIWQIIIENKHDDLIEIIIKRKEHDEEFGWVQIGKELPPQGSH